MFQRATSMPSRRSSVKLGALHTSATTPHSSSSISAAAITSRRIVPEPMSWARGFCLARLFRAPAPTAGVPSRNR